MNWENLEPGNKAKKEYEEARKKIEEEENIDYGGAFAIGLLIVALLLYFFKGSL